MFVSRLARSYGILDRQEARALTMISPPPFSITLFRRARIIEKFGEDIFGIPNEDEVIVPEESGRRVRQRRNQTREDPPVIPVEKGNTEWDNVELRRYLDDIGRGINYNNESFVYLFEQMNITLRPEPRFPYVMSWEERV